MLTKEYIRKARRGVLPLHFLPLCLNMCITFSHLQYVQGGLCKFPFYNLEWEEDEVKGNECSKGVCTKLTVMRPNVCLKGFSRLSNFVKKIKDNFVCSFNEMLLSFFEVNGHIDDMLHSIISQVLGIFVSLDLLVCMQIPILEDVPQT